MLPSLAGDVDQPSIVDRDQFRPALANGIDLAVGVEGGVAADDDGAAVGGNPVMAVLVGGFDFPAGGGVDEELAVE